MVNIFDDDMYEVHNMSGQLCKQKHIGKYKTESLADTIRDFCNEEIFTFEEKYTHESLANSYMFSAFDNMQARRDMFINWKNYAGMLPEAVFIDGRLNPEQLQIFCVKGGDVKAMEEYEKFHLFSDNEVQEAACTFKQTSHAAAMIASHMVGFFTNYYSNVVTQVESRSVPFYWEYYIPIDLLTQEEQASGVPSLDF